jgi:hypothetical protein
MRFAANIEPRLLFRLRDACPILLAILLVGSAQSAFALSKEAAVENCRMTVGRPIVQACMRASGDSGNREACRAKAHPQVRACVMAALNAANGRANVAVAIPTEAAPKAPAANALPAGFVAPPRTISDITAILESEKPDLKKIEELKADADAAPTGKESREDLAQFYFDRGNARAQLGRLADSIADANKAMEVGRGAVSPNMMGRLMQLASIQYSAAGDPEESARASAAPAPRYRRTPGRQGVSVQR